MTLTIKISSGVKVRLPFSHINLRHNPFGELDQQQRVKVAVVDIEKYKHILNKKGHAIQFLADHGRGKTTHLLSLHQYYPTAEYTQLYPGDKPDMSLQVLRFVDSVENLSKQQRIAMYKNSPSLACTTHTDLTKELTGAGYKVENIKVSMRNIETIRLMFNRRIEFSRRYEGNIPLIDTHLVSELIKRFGDDIRAMEHYLYEVFQKMEEIENVKM